jgi:hypothetical protein
MSYYKGGRRPPRCSRPPRGGLLGLGRGARAGSPPGGGGGGGVGAANANRPVARWLAGPNRPLNHPRPAPQGGGNFQRPALPDPPRPAAAPPPVWCLGCGASPSAPCGDAPWPLWRCALAPMGPAGAGCPAKAVGAAKAAGARWIAQRRLWASSYNTHYSVEY